MDKKLTIDFVIDLEFAGTWLKDENFNFLEISKKVAKILYDKDACECVGRNDFDISRELGSKLSEEQFAEICRASDTYVENFGEPATFIEFITDTKGEQHIWETTKRMQIVNGKRYYYGFAMFLDVICGNYEMALKDFMKQQTIKINDNLFLLDKMAK